MMTTISNDRNVISAIL